jgi:hypothetical protein
LTQEKFWIAVGSIATTAVLVYTIRQNSRKEKRGLDNLKELLIFELTTNVDSIFSGGIERPSLLEGVSVLRNKYLKAVKSKDILNELQKLYLELEHYHKKIDIHYTKVDRRYITQYQLDACNVFLKHFGHKPVEYSFGLLNTPTEAHANKYIEERMDEARATKQKNFNKWQDKIREEVYQLFASSKEKGRQ